MTKIKTPKYDKRNYKSLTIDELEMLCEACQTVKQRALLEVTYASGCRLDEIHKMNIADIDFINFSAKVIGKGNKERTVFFSLKAIHHLKKYLKTRNDNCEALFVTEKGEYKRLSRRGIEREFSKIVKNSQIKKNVSFHSLRHTYCTLMIERGADLRTVQELMGHSSPRNYGSLFLRNGRT
ncbi:tyrosine-type recombinase/integrase [Neobacillus paridis]|uniref:tyrosine-type recombinase/integrase n=1 Tax=Neobacillus paridis TaxID=2803862 RepID=UPI001F3BBBD1|nr:tyrosine-type recombinase/integrase [Neobacillus paridis]